MRFLEYLKRFTYTPNEFYDHLMGLEDAACGDVQLKVLPAMTGASSNEQALEPTVSEMNGPADDANYVYVLPVTVSVVNSKGKVSTFFNGIKEAKVDITTAAGKIAINDGDAGAAGVDPVAFDLQFVNGVASFDIVCSGTWAEDDTIKGTVDDSDTKILSTSVEITAHFLAKVVADPVEEPSG